MAGLLEFLGSNTAAILTAGGLLIGIAFGATASATNFCVMGAIADRRNFGSNGRLGAVALAAAVAIVLTQALAAHAIVDLSRSMYLAPRVNWAGAILGGLVFGAGMVYAGGCASRALVRAGGGDLRAAMVLLTLAIAAFATISGVLAPLRASFETMTALDLAGSGIVPSLDGLAGAAGLAPELARSGGALVLVLPLALFALVQARVLSTPVNLWGGIAVGLLVTAGWLLTGMAFDEFDVRPLAPGSLSFVRPVADAIDWLQRSTALGLPGFGAATIFGTLAGSFLHAHLTGRSRFAGFADARDAVRHLGGAAAMGIGGVFALGCSIGQGVTGLSTLSVHSLLAGAAIYSGARLALARLEREV